MLIHMLCIQYRTQEFFTVCCVFTGCCLVTVSKAVDPHLLCLRPYWPATVLQPTSRLAAIPHQPPTLLIDSLLSQDTRLSNKLLTNKPISIPGTPYVAYERTAYKTPTPILRLFLHNLSRGLLPSNGRFSQSFFSNGSRSLRFWKVLVATYVTVVYFLVDSLTLKMEATRSFEMSADIKRTTR
jgi:hypothetical protein